MQSLIRLFNFLTIAFTGLLMLNYAVNPAPGIDRLHPIGGFFVCYGMGAIAAGTAMAIVIRILDPERLNQICDEFLERLFRLLDI